MKDRLFISTVAKDAADTAIKYDIGVEIAIFCTAPNMDIHFEKVDKYVRNLLSNINRSTLHAPFNELYTASVDPLVIELAQKRYNRAYELASLYKSRSIIFHDSFIPDIYYPQWFVPESAKFWKEFINDKDDNINIHIR